MCSLHSEVVVTTGRPFSRRLFGFQRQSEHCPVGTSTMASPTDRVFFVNFLIDGPSLSESTLIGRWRDRFLVLFKVLPALGIDLGVFSFATFLSDSVKLSSRIQSGSSFSGFEWYSDSSSATGVIGIELTSWDPSSIGKSGLVDSMTNGGLIVGKPPMISSNS